jgi:hypothetical protein
MRGTMSGDAVRERRLGDGPWILCINTRAVGLPCADCARAAPDISGASQRVDGLESYHEFCVGELATHVEMDAELRSELDSRSEARPFVSLTISGLVDSEYCGSNDGTAGCTRT